MVPSPDAHRSAWWRLAAGLSPGRGGTLTLAALGAVLYWAALPPLGLWPLAWVAPVPWIVLIRRGDLPGRPYLAWLTWWLVGFCFWLAALQWLRLSHPAAYLGWFVLSAYLACYLVAFVALSRIAVHRLKIPLILAVPVVWAGVELARNSIWDGFAMASLSHTQYRQTGLIQISDLAGEYAVGFLILFVAACVARMLPSRDRPRAAIWPLVPAAALLAAALFYGHLRLSVEPDQPAGPATRIALIQGNINTEIKFDPGARKRVFIHYLRLSREALGRFGKVDLMVWPETMYRYPLVSYDPEFTKPDWLEVDADEFHRDLPKLAQESREGLGMLARTLGVPMIVGVEVFHYGKDEFRCYNSVVSVTAAGDVVDRYDKVELVMFGEYVPFASFVPLLTRLTPATFQCTAGAGPKCFRAGRLRLSPSICYETTFPQVVRRQVSRLAAAGQEPDVLINVTNDGWFRGSAELDQHLACGVFRAVECRKPLLVAANTGFSAWVDAGGRIIKQGPRRAPGLLLAEIRSERRFSPYVAYGDWPAGICLAACVGIAAAGLGGWFLRRREGRGGKAEKEEAPRPARKGIRQQRLTGGGAG
jgi:apolipoprotein N-acyltransferase